MPRIGSSSWYYLVSVKDTDTHQRCLERKVVHSHKIMVDIRFRVGLCSLKSWFWFIFLASQPWDLHFLCRFAWSVSEFSRHFSLSHVLLFEVSSIPESSLMLYVLVHAVCACQCCCFANLKDFFLLNLFLFDINIFFGCQILSVLIEIVFKILLLG